MLIKDNFGIVLKKIRKNNGDSLRATEEKTGINNSYIDKIEKNTRPINKKNISLLIKAYPLNAEELAKAYINEVVPSECMQTLNKIKNSDNDNNNQLSLLYDTIFKELDTNEQKTILYNMLDKYKLKLVDKGIYKVHKNLIDEIKNKIDNL